MTDITIPPEALEAAAKALAADAKLNWDDIPYSHNILLSEARTACLAMIKAWPGVHIHEWQRPWLGGMSGTDIILPLTENSNERE